MQWSATKELLIFQKQKLVAGSVLIASGRTFFFQEIQIARLTKKKYQSVFGSEPCEILKFG